MYHPMEKKELRKQGAEVVEGDLLNPASVQVAMRKAIANSANPAASAAAVQHRRVSGASRGARGPPDRKASKQSWLAPSQPIRVPQ